MAGVEVGRVECPWAKVEKPVIRGSDIIDGQKAAGSKFFFFLPIAVTHVPNVRNRQYDYCTLVLFPHQKEGTTDSIVLWIPDRVLWHSGGGSQGSHRDAMGYHQIVSKTQLHLPDIT